MKQKDFFTQLSKQGKISDEVVKFIDTLPDVDIPDDFVKAHDNSFMTLDRAAAHKEIHRRIKSESLDPIDKTILAFYDSIKEYGDPSLENIVKQDGNTYDKLEALKKYMPNLIKKAKGSPNTDEETKKKLAEVERNFQESQDKLTSTNSEWEKKFDIVNKDWKKKFESYQLNSELERLTNKYTLAEPFEETRPHINEVALAKIKASNNLKLSEKNGRPFIQVFDEDGKPKYNGNNPVAIDSLLDEAYKPFLKKSESKSQENRSTRAQTTLPDNKSKGVSTTVR